MSLMIVDHIIPNRILGVSGVRRPVTLSKTFRGQDDLIPNTMCHSADQR